VPDDAPVSLGAHVGQQNLEMDALRSTWRRLDGAGLDWISAWDHFYEAPPAGGTMPHFEAVATLAALALSTERARIGCLVFYVGYRNPGQLAKAVTTIDHLSWSVRARPRRRLARTGGGRVRLRVSRARSAAGHAGGGGATHPLTADQRAHDL